MKKTVLMVFLAMLCTLSLYAQERRITGKVTSTEDGTPLPGVNVLIKGTSIGTVTDAEGFYSLDIANSTQSIVFSFIGLRSEEVVVGERSVIDVGLR